MRQLIKKIAFPVLNRWYQAKSKKVSTYKRYGLSITVQPMVFHPGVFLSTNIFVHYLQTLDLKDKRILELGAGSGLIALFCAKNGATATATDINKSALAGLKENASKNGLSLNVIESDLFENVHPNDFDLIIVNPPYYPQKANSQQELAFYCGENFEYFHTLFEQLKEQWRNPTAKLLMILSEDCDINQIRAIGLDNSIVLTECYSTKKRGEKNYIFQLSHGNNNKGNHTP